MRKISRRMCAGLLLAVGASLTGCGGSSSGTKPNAQVRSVDVGTNLVNDQSNFDTSELLINGGASSPTVNYGTPGPYYFLQSGTSQFVASTTEPEPTITYPPGTNDNNTLPVIVTIQPITDIVNLSNGSVYTSFLVGRPDIPNPTELPTPPSTTPPDLDPRYISVVVLQDNQAAPASGHATVRVMSAVPDISVAPSTLLGKLPTLTVSITGAGNSATYSNVTYATQASSTTPDQSLIAGTVTVSVAATYTGTSGTTTVNLPLSSNTLNLASGAKYTLVVDEPNDVTINAEAPQDVTQTVSYGLSLIQN